MQSIQVLKGPQGTLFGKDTTGGAIIFTPNKPTHDFSGGLLGSYGNYDRKEVNGYVNLPLTDTLALRLAGDHTDHHGYTDNISGPDLDSENYTSGRAILSWTPIKQFGNELMFDYVHGREPPDPGQGGRVRRPLLPLCELSGVEFARIGAWPAHYQSAFRPVRPHRRLRHHRHSHP